MAVTTPAPDRTAPDRTPAEQPVELPAAAAEVRALQAVQRGDRAPPGGHRRPRHVARSASTRGGWLALGVLGALADRRRRRDWLTAAAGVAAAHGASVAVKRVVRRPRPADPRVRVLVGTPSRLSFPSAHATSTTAAAVLYGRLLGRPLTPLLVPPMALSRLVLGVHYPTDVAAGALASAPRLAAAASKRGARRRRIDHSAPHLREVPAMTDIEVPPAPVAPARTPLGVARGVLKTMRPRQWVKNVLVFAAPFVGGDLLTPGIVPKLLIAFVAFSLAASGIYLVNDAKDVVADRAHPTKRFRPIAAGSWRRGSPSRSRSCCSPRPSG